VSGVPWRIITDSVFYDRIYWRLLCTISLNYKQYSDVADLHIFQFTVVHALGFSVYTSRILATDLNTGTITWNYYEVVLSFSSSITLDCRLTRTRPNSPIQSLLCCIPILLVMDSVLISATNRFPLYSLGSDIMENTFYCCRDLLLRRTQLPGKNSRHWP
jgi:hypothetical protein